MKKTALYNFVIALSLIGCTPTVSDIYITPNGEEFKNGELVFSSIEEGINSVAQLRKEGVQNTLTIHLRAGDHRITSPVRIQPELGPLKLIGEGMDKTVVKGSKVLNSKWEKFNDHIWVAKLQKEDNFDQLFINGNRQILARYPNYDENGGHWQGHAEDAISPERIKTWANPVGVIVHAMHSGEWGGFHYVSTGIDENGELVLSGGHQNNRPSNMHAKYRMVENVFEELDAPGEWFLDKNYRLFFWPAEETDLGNALIEGVQLKHLVEVVGTEEIPVKNIEISGIKS